MTNHCQQRKSRGEKSVDRRQNRRAPRGVSRHTALAQEEGDNYGGHAWDVAAAEQQKQERPRGGGTTHKYSQTSRGAEYNSRKRHQKSIRIGRAWEGYGKIPGLWQETDERGLEQKQTGAKE